MRELGDFLDCRSGQNNIADRPGDALDPEHGRSINRQIQIGCFNFIIAARRSRTFISLPPCEKFVA